MGNQQKKSSPNYKFTFMDFKNSETAGQCYYRAMFVEPNSKLVIKIRSH